MKKQLLVIALAALTSAAFAQGTPASTATPRVDQREAKQEQRIANGVSSGRLTPKETARLEGEQSRIAASEAKAKSDGVVTAKERRALHRKQDRASRHIFKQKHDAQHA
jgi:hypothetical protein